MEAILSLMLIFIEAFSGKLFLDCFFVPKKFKNNYIKVVLLCIIGILYCAGIFLMSDYLFIRIAFVIIIGSVIWGAYYQGKNLKIGLIYFLYIALAMLVEYCTIIIVGKIVPNSAALMSESTFFAYAISFLIKFILLMIIFIIRAIKDRYKVEAINKEGWMCIGIFAFFTVIAITAMFSNWKMVENNKQANVLVCILAGLVVMNMILFYMINQIIRIEKSEKDSGIFRERLQKEIETYKINQDNREEIKELTHEFNNILTMLKSNDYEIEELKNIAGNTEKRLSENADMVNTKNSTANIVLNAKIREMRKKDICLTMELDDLSMLKMEEEDIFIILSNLLNNAIEASEKCDRKTVNIKLVYDEPCFIISVRNSIKERPQIRNGKYITSKKENSEMHGIGISNIIKSVEKYGGDWDISYTDDYFIFTILIKINDKILNL